MDVAQMQSLIQSYGFTSDTASQQLDFLNATYRDVHGQARWPFLEAIDNSQSTVAGTASYTPPMANWRNLDAVRIAQPTLLNFMNIEYMDPQQLFDMANVDPAATATPRYWTMYESKIWFFPTPDAVYNITYYYIQEPADLVNPTDVPVIPLPYHNVLVYGAICGITYRERDWIGLELWTQKYQDTLQKMKEEYRLRQRQTSSQVRESGYWNTEINYPLTSTGF